MFGEAQFQQCEIFLVFVQFLTHDNLMLGLGSSEVNTCILCRFHVSSSYHVLLTNLKLLSDMLFNSYYQASRL